MISKKEQVKNAIEQIKNDSKMTLEQKYHCIVFIEQNANIINLNKLHLDDLKLLLDII